MKITTEARIEDLIAGLLDVREAVDRELELLRITRKQISSGCLEEVSFEELIPQLH